MNPENTENIWTENTENTWIVLYSRMGRTHAVKIGKPDVATSDEVDAIVAAVEDRVGSWSPEPIEPLGYFDGDQLQDGAAFLVLKRGWKSAPGQVEWV